MGVNTQGIPRVCKFVVTPASLGYPLSVFNKHHDSALNNTDNSGRAASGVALAPEPPRANRSKPESRNLSAHYINQVSIFFFSG